MTHIDLVRSLAVERREQAAAFADVWLDNFYDRRCRIGKITVKAAA